MKVANEQLGGIDGHPVALKKCFIKNAEEEGTTCGQKLGNDKDIAAINVGGVAIGIQPFYSTIGGKKPVIVGVAATPVDGVQDNATVLFGDATHVLGPFGSYAKDGCTRRPRRSSIRTSRASPTARLRSTRA